VRLWLQSRHTFGNVMRRDEAPGSIAALRCGRPYALAKFCLVRLEVKHPLSEPTGNDAQSPLRRMRRQALLNCCTPLLHLRLQIHLVCGHVRAHRIHLCGAALASLAPVAAAFVGIGLSAMVALAAAASTSPTAGPGSSVSGPRRWLLGSFFAEPLSFWKKIRATLPRHRPCVQPLGFDVVGNEHCLSRLCGCPLSPIASQNAVP
jgi:hypothetical protein